MSHQTGCREVFNEIGVLKTFTNFIGNQLSWNLFFDNVPGKNSVTSFKNRLQHRCFPVNFM